MRIVISPIAHWDKHGRPPRPTIYAHPLDTNPYVADPRHMVRILPKPGYSDDDVAGWLFGVRRFETEVPDDFWRWERERAGAWLLEVVRGRARKVGR